MKRFGSGLGLVALACTFGLLGGGIVIYLRPAQATRNSAGTETIPNTFVSGTTISSSAVNANFADLGVEMTDSLNRSGKGGMLAALRGIDGTVAAPAFSWTSETGSGLYRIGASDVGFAINGSKMLEITSSNVGFSGTISQSVSGSASTTLVSFLEPSLSNGNQVLAYLGKAVSANAAGNLSFNPNATAANSTMCMQIHGQSNTLCVDGNNTTKIGTNGTGITVFQMKRGTAGCSTGTGIGNTCNTTVTWANAFADTTYAVICMAIGASGGSPVLQSAVSLTTTTANFTTMNGNTSGVAATFSTVDCIGIHP